MQIKSFYLNGKKAQINKPINLTSSLKASNTISSVKSLGFISSRFPKDKKQECLIFMNSQRNILPFTTPLESHLKNLESLFKWQPLCFTHFTICIQLKLKTSWILTLHLQCLWHFYLCLCDSEVHKRYKTTKHLHHSHIGEIRITFCHHWYLL